MTRKQQHLANALLKRLDLLAAFLKLAGGIMLCVAVGLL